MTTPHPAPLPPPRQTPFANEKDFQAAYNKRVRDVYGGDTYHPIGTGASKAGTPDNLSCIPTELGGRFCAIELKQPGKVPTALQQKRLRSFQAAGAVAGWATTMVEVDALLSHAGDPTWVNPNLLTPGDAD